MTPVQTIISAIEMIPENLLHKGHLLSSLQSMEETEKEFVKTVWMEGLTRGFKDGKGEENNKPTLPEFLKQLYPGK